MGFHVFEIMKRVNLHVFEIIKFPILHVFEIMKYENLHDFEIITKSKKVNRLFINVLYADGTSPMRLS